MALMNIIAVILIVIAVYGGELRYRPGESKPIYWILFGIALVLMIMSAAISGEAI